MQLTVTSLRGDQHRITIRGHELLVDQPLADGGGDTGPTPTELFVASLASCVAHYARHGLGMSGEGPAVRCTWAMSDAPPWRVSSIDVDVLLPSGTSEQRVAAVRRAIQHCTVHNTLVQPPSVRVSAAVAELA